MLAWLAAGAAAASDTVKTKSGLPQFNVPDMLPQLIWLALTFGLMYLILSKVTLPRIASVIHERQGRIQRDLDEAERLKSETDQAIAAYEQGLAEAHSHANSIVRDMHEQLAIEINEERAKADAEIASIIAEAQERIETSKSQAMIQVDAIAIDTAGAVITKLTGIEASQTEINAALSTNTSAGE